MIANWIFRNMIENDFSMVEWQTICIVKTVAGNLSMNLLRAMAIFYTFTDKCVYVCSKIVVLVLVFTFIYVLYVLYLFWLNEKTAQANDTKRFTDAYFYSCVCSKTQQQLFFLNSWKLLIVIVFLFFRSFIRLFIQFSSR